VIECVPNISEGVRQDLVQQIAAAAAATGCLVLDVHMDPDHHRSVVTFVGEPDVVEAGAIELIRSSIALLDLRDHQGVHPRIGIVDVVPFIALRDASMEDCIALARRVGEAVAERFALPVFLYGRAATRERRRGLAALRRGQITGLAERLRLPEWTPDFGPHRLHETAGAVAIGAREFLVAFNIVLDTSDVSAARDIARRVRGSNGGLPGVQALGLMLASRGLAQVSMNLVDVRTTGLQEAFDAVSQQAKALGIGILESEIVGLVPRSAIGESTSASIALPGDLNQSILEHRIAEANL